MTKREMNLAIFRREPIPQVFFQPRIESWIDMHTRLGDLPQRFWGMSLVEIYDKLDLSIRYIHYYTGLESPLVGGYTTDVKVVSKETSQGWLRAIETPYGDLVTEYTNVELGGCRITDFPLKTRDDIRKVEWLIDHTWYRFDPEAFRVGDQFMGDRGEPQFFLPRSPYQALALDWMRFEDFIFAIADDPAPFEHLMKKIDDSYDDLFRQLEAYGKLNILNFGENMDARLTSPRYFEKYFIPFYEKRGNQLKRAGIYSHIHFDGAIKPVLKYLKDLPFDGYEALTPVPQGDVTLEEMQQAIGDKILLDGIPAILFLETYPMEQLQQCAEELVQRFHPRLVLGISDEIPQASTDEGIRRLEWVNQYCQSCQIA